MEQYYLKKGRRYVPAGYSFPDMDEGLYWRQKMPNGTRTTSICHWAGSNPPQPLNIEKLIAVMSQDDRLARYVGKLTDPESDEFKKAKEDQGDFITGPLQFYNWSAQDLASCILRFAFEEMKDEDSKQG